MVCQWLSLLGELFDPLLTRCKLLSTHSQEAPVGLTFSTPNQDVIKAADDLQWTRMKLYCFCKQLLERQLDVALVMHECLPPQSMCMHVIQRQLQRFLNSLHILIYLYWEILKSQAHSINKYFIKFLLCARYCCRYWSYSSNRNRLKLLPSSSFFFLNFLLGKKFQTYTEGERIIFLLFGCNNYQCFVILFSSIPPTTCFFILKWSVLKQIPDIKYFIINIL